MITLKVTTENKSLHEALRLNQEVRNKLIAQLKSHNMPAERVHASKFSSTPRFGLFGEKAKSYKVENLVRITVEDEHEFQLTASTVSSFAEVQFVGAEFEVKDKEATKAKAIAQACDNANQRRSMMEEKFGMSLKASGFSSTPVLQSANSENRRYPSASYENCKLQIYSKTGPAAENCTRGGRARCPHRAAAPPAGSDSARWGHRALPIAPLTPPCNFSLRRGVGFELYEGMHLVFETATEGDATELAEIRNNAAKKLTEKFGKGPWSGGCAEKGVLYGMRTSRMLVARENGKIVGTLSLHTKKPWAIDPSYFTKVRKPLYLTSMFVAVERQGTGFGRRLLEEAMEIAREWPSDAIRLDAYDAKAGAGDFYAKCGFREVGRAEYKGVGLRYFEWMVGA